MNGWPQSKYSPDLEFKSSCWLFMVKETQQDKKTSEKKNGNEKSEATKGRMKRSTSLPLVVKLKNCLHVITVTIIKRFFYSVAVTQYATV